MLIFYGENRYGSPLLPQLTSLLDSLTDTTAENGELLFQLRDFRFIEETGTRYCYLDVDLYAKDDASYHKLSSLDTLLIIGTRNVEKLIRIWANRILSDFLAKGLVQQPTDPHSYSIGDIAGMDDLEKKEIPVYNTTRYTDGIYMNYTSFRDQQPDRQGMVDTKKDGSISSVKVLDPAGKKIKLKSKNIYAVIEKGQIFIATEYGFYPMQKVNKALFFTGDIRNAASSADLAGAQMALGLLGSALAYSSGDRMTYDLIIDHRSGQFIRIRLIPKPVQP